METEIKVSIQGAYGSFHEEASLKYFATADNEIKIIPCTTFAESLDMVETGNSDYALMAIENTVAGTILPNYALLRASNLEITGEIYIRIVQNLLICNEAAIEDLKEVYSHPMAIFQSSNFFRKFSDIKLIESTDTASSAKKVADNQNVKFGAIASKLAAERYNLKIAGESIENNKQNYTRFFALSLKTFDRKNYHNINKVSMCFALPHEKGSLANVLSVISAYGINLHKIQSHPIIGKPWQYLFYIDLGFDDYFRYKQTLQAIEPLTTNLQILGEYKQAKKSLERIHTILK